MVTTVLRQSPARGTVSQPNLWLGWNLVVDACPCAAAAGIGPKRTLAVVDDAQMWASVVCAIATRAPASTPPKSEIALAVDLQPQVTTLRCPTS